MDFNASSSIFMDFYRFSLISMGFHGCRGLDVTAGKGQPAAPIETFARFQAGFLSSEDFHRFLSIFIDLYDFYRFS